MTRIQHPIRLFPAHISNSSLLLGVAQGLGDLPVPARLSSDPISRSNKNNYRTDGWSSLMAQAVGSRYNTSILEGWERCSRAIAHIRFNFLRLVQYRTGQDRTIQYSTVQAHHSLTGIHLKNRNTSICKFCHRSFIVKHHHTSLGSFITFTFTSPLISSHSHLKVKLSFHYL
jgi:hypothetical protein